MKISLSKSLMQSATLLAAAGVVALIPVAAEAGAAGGGGGGLGLRQIFSNIFADIYFGGWIVLAIGIATGAISYLVGMFEEIGKWVFRLVVAGGIMLAAGQLDRLIPGAQASGGSIRDLAASGQYIPNQG